jgi:excisionase family DNA binding protein
MEDIVLLFDRGTAAKSLHVSLPTLDRLIRRQELPVIRIGRSVRIEPAALQEFVRARAVHPMLRDFDLTDP